jgi:hypothetical protein
LTGARKTASIYTAASVAKEREALYKVAADTADANHALFTSFHYKSYNFDSTPAEFWNDAGLAQEKAHVEGLWFTGGLTD